MTLADRSLSRLRPKDIRHDIGLSREKVGYVMSVSAKT